MLNFRESFVNINQYKPDIVSLLEPIVSGTKVDTVIAKLRFENSH